MKLILKRAGEDPRLYRKLSEGRSPKSIPDTRPFVLCTEDGEQLPCQQTTSLNSVHGELTTVTVVFQVDGCRVLVEGDK